jgi:hypothetical protein
LCGKIGLCRLPCVFEKPVDEVNHAARGRKGLFTIAKPGLLGRSGRSGLRPAVKSDLWQERIQPAAAKFLGRCDSHD